MHDSRTIDWKGIIAEGTAVVVSILIAFWIDAWWQERSERKALVEYLVHFENEVIANDELIDIHLSAISDDLIALHKVFLALSDSDQQVLTESFNHDLANSLWIRSPEVSMDAFDELTTSGNLRFVSNAQFKIVFNDYRNRADYLDASYNFSTSLYLDHSYLIFQQLSSY